MVGNNVTDKVRQATHIWEDSIKVEQGQREINYESLTYVYELKIEVKCGVSFEKINVLKKKLLSTKT